MRKGVQYDFGGFRVDTEQRCLMRDEELVSLTPKAFETLLVLVSNRGKVISKDSLLDQVWKDTFVEEATLAQNISTLRKTLAKYESGTDFIVTIPKRGYRFVADVTASDTDEEVLVVEKHSVTRIIADLEEVDSRPFPYLSGLSRKLLIGVPAALGLIFAIVAAGYFYFSGGSTQFESKFRDFRMSTLFSGEDITQTAISPDGKYIAVVQRRSEGDQLLLRQVSEGNAVKLTQEDDLSISGIVFSPENDSVYYSAYKRSEPFPKYGNLYNVPLLGGASRMIKEDVDGPISFSPDSKRFAFVRGVIDTMESVLMTASIDGSDEKRVASRSLRSEFSTNGLSWSPDGISIAVTAFDRKDRIRPMKLLTVDIATGKQNILSDNKWVWIGRAAWLKDGSGIVVIAFAEQSPNLTDEVWFVSYPGGLARSVTRGLNGITGVGITADGKTMIAGKNNRLTTRSYLSLDQPETTNVIAKTVSEDNMSSLGANWIGKDRLIYAKTQNGNADIWTMNTDGSSNIQLTSEPRADYDPVLTADGKKVYFRSNRKDSLTIWRMDSDGSNQVEIIDTPRASTPSLPADGSAIYYSAQPPDSYFPVLWKSDPDGQNRQRLSDARAFYPIVSPDGKYLLCFAADSELAASNPAAPIRLTLFSIPENKIVLQFEIVQRGKFPLQEWKHDSTGFYQIINGDDSSELTERDLSGKVIRTIKHWNEGKVFQMALSEDGKRLFFEKGEDVMSVLKFTDSGS